MILKEKQNMLCMLENSVPTAHLNWVCGTFFFICHCNCRASEHSDGYVDHHQVNVWIPAHTVGFETAFKLADWYGCMLAKI